MDKAMISLSRWAIALLSAVLVVAIPIILVATPLYLYVRPGYVEARYAQPGFPASSRFSPAERRRLSEPILRYLRGQVSVEEMAATRTDAGEIALLPDEVQHLVDVRQVMDGFYIAHAVACILALGAGLLLWRSAQRAQIPHLLRRGVWIVLGLMALVLASSLLDFDAFFTRFHQVFFREGTWIFDEQDTLIQLYPLPLWVDAVLGYTLTILAEALAMLGLAWASGRRWSRKARP